ncbi:MAG: type II secretion system protein GspG [Phycisphaerae bacterium]
MCCNTQANANGGPGRAPLGKGRRPRRGRPGFSFIEIMVVVVIIGLLAGAVAMKVTGYMDTAKVNRAKSDIAVIVNAIEARYLETSRYPANEEGLDELPLKNRTDPWGNPYQYNSPGRDDEPFEVFSFGADAREGGEGIHRDIYSWQLGDVDEEG